MALAPTHYTAGFLNILSGHSYIQFEQCLERYECVMRIRLKVYFSHNNSGKIH